MNQNNQQNPNQIDIASIDPDMAFQELVSVLEVHSAVPSRHVVLAACAQRVKMVLDEAKAKTQVESVTEQVIEAPVEVAAKPN